MVLQRIESVVEIPENVVDWVLVEFRDAEEASSATSSTVVGQIAAFITIDGTIISSTGQPLIPFNHIVQEGLFVVVWHRNHLGIMSANPLDVVDGIYNYDYSSAADQVYGGNVAHKELTAGIWGMVAGDANADGDVNNIDKNEYWPLRPDTPGIRRLIST